MKVGACIWNFNVGPYCAPYEDAIRAVAKLGFQGGEPMIFSREDIDDYYTPAKVRELASMLKDHNLAVPQVSVYDNVLHDLASFDVGARQQTVDLFRRSVEIAKGLGTSVVNTVSQWPTHLKAPLSYPPIYIYPDMRGVGQLSPKLRMDLPQGWSWEKTWDYYVDAISRCLDVAAEHGVTFSIEGHCHVIVSGADAMLRLVDAVDGHKNLGFTIDTGWHMRMREYLPMTIYKLGQRIKCFHIRDTDGLLSYSLPAGQGIVHWGHVVEALNDVGYDGFLNVEMANMEDPKRVFTQAKEYLETVLAEFTPKVSQTRVAGAA